MKKSVSITWLKYLSEQIGEPELKLKVDPVNLIVILKCTTVIQCSFESVVIELLRPDQTALQYEFIHFSKKMDPGMKKHIVSEIITKLPEG